MPCKHYKNALVEAAASEVEPQGEFRAHLVGCADCRTAFEQERVLFSFIDAGLHVAANAEVPASLLPRVRAELDKTAEARRRWFQPWIFAAASVTLALAIFQFARPHHSGRDNQTKQILQVEAPAKDAGHRESGPATQVVSNMNSSQTRVHSTLLRPATSSQPEVLVPPDEREAFSHFVAVLDGQREVALALVRPVLQTKDEPASLEPLQIKGLEIKTLEERQTEVSDEAEQRL